MSKAFLDTTVFADLLLKPSTKGKIVKAALRRFDETELPVYAIKELKAGALRGYIWLHNTFVTEASFAGTILRIQALSRTPQRNLTSTALQALAEASVEFNEMTSEALVNYYGEKASGNSMQVDAYRLRLKELVYRAWKKKRSVTTRVVIPLECYAESDIYDDRFGLIKYDPYKCSLLKECALGDRIRTNINDVRKLEAAAKSMPSGIEQKRRYNALHDICRKPRDYVTEKMCRALGDAMFAFLAPKDATILTTNMKDHEPLAQALGKHAERP